MGKKKSESDLSFFGRSLRAASFVMSPAKAMAFKAAEEERINLDRAQRARDIFKQSAERGEAVEFIKACHLFGQFDTLTRLAQSSDSPMELACRAPKNSEEMIAALIRESPRLQTAIMVVSHVGCLAPIDLCAHLGNWRGAEFLASCAGAQPLDRSLLLRSINALSTRYQERLNSSGYADERCLSETLGEWRDALSFLRLFGEDPLSAPDRAHSRFPIASALDSLGALKASAPEPAWAYLGAPHFLLLSWLSAHGADVNQLSPNGESALRKAACAFDLPCCEVLIKLGASLEALDANNNTPLIAMANALELAQPKRRSGVAAHYELDKPRALNVARALIKSGADGSKLASFSFFNHSAPELFCSAESAAIETSSELARGANGLGSRRVLCKIKPRAAGSSSGASSSSSSFSSKPF